MLVDEIIDRLDQVSAPLEKRVEGAVQLSDLIKRGAFPAPAQFAFVLPNRLSGRGAGEASANAFVQSVDETISVLLVVRSAGDITGGKSLPKFEALIDDTIARVAGWGPDTEPGVFRLASGQLVSANDGHILYQLDFTILTQIRNL